MKLISIRDFCTAEVCSSAFGLSAPVAWVRAENKREMFELRPFEGLMKFTQTKTDPRVSIASISFRFL